MAKKLIKPCIHCRQDPYPHPLWQVSGRVKMDWLGLERDLRAILSLSIDDKAKIGRIDDCIAAHTRRGHALQGCGSCGREDF